MLRCDNHLNNGIIKKDIKLLERNGMFLILLFYPILPLLTMISSRLSVFDKVDSFDCFDPVDIDSNCALVFESTDIVSDNEFSVESRSICVTGSLSFSPVLRSFDKKSMIQK